MFTINTRYAPFRRVHVTFNAFLTVSRPIAISSQQRKDPSIGGLKFVARPKAATAAWAELVHPAVVKDWRGAQQQRQALVWDGDLPSYQSYTRITFSVCLDREQQLRGPNVYTAGGATSLNRVFGRDEYLASFEHFVSVQKKK